MQIDETQPLSAVSERANQLPLPAEIQQCGADMLSRSAEQLHLDSWGPSSRAETGGADRPASMLALHTHGCARRQRDRAIASRERTRGSSSTGRRLL